MEFKTNDLVRMMNNEMHERNSNFYPVKDTIGRVTSVGCDSCIIQWTKGTTSMLDEWSCPSKYLTLHKRGNKPRSEVQSEQDRKRILVGFHLTQDQTKQAIVKYGTVTEINKMVKEFFLQELVK